MVTTCHYTSTQSHGMQTPGMNPKVNYGLTTDWRWLGCVSIQQIHHFSKGCWQWVTRGRAEVYGTSLHIYCFKPSAARMIALWLPKHEQVPWVQSPAPLKNYLIKVYKKKKKRKEVFATAAQWTKDENRRYKKPGVRSCTQISWPMYFFVAEGCSVQCKLLSTGRTA